MNSYPSSPSHIQNAARDYLMVLACPSGTTNPQIYRNVIRCLNWNITAIGIAANKSGSGDLAIDERTYNISIPATKQVHTASIKVSLATSTTVKLEFSVVDSSSEYEVRAYILGSTAYSGVIFLVLTPQWG